VGKEQEIIQVENKLNVSNLDQHLKGNTQQCKK
jgi:hypothetical protein